MSFMFETRFPQHLTEFAAKEAPLQDDYIDCWTSLEKKFDGTPGKKMEAMSSSRFGHRPNLGRARAEKAGHNPLPGASTRTRRRLR
jgi:hypothetical protein